MFYQHQPKSSLQTIKKELDENPKTAYVDNLFRFVKKSALLGKLSNINPDNENIIILQKAIQAGDYDAPIFNTEDCYLNLLYLIEKQKVEFWQGMSVYAYLIGLMQYTNKQALKEEDKDVKLIRPGHPFSVVKMVENNQLTEAGKIYVEGFATKLTELVSSIPNYDDLNIAIRISNLTEKLTLALLSLSPVDQWLFNIPFDPPPMHKDFSILPSRVKEPVAIQIDKLIKLVSNEGSPHLFRHIMDDKYYCFMPSFAFLNIILSTIFSDPLQYLPIFGSINEDTLKALHAQGLHPLSLYAPHVKSNIKLVHELRSGPFPALFHDVGHVFWGSFLIKEARDVIFINMLPLLEELEKNIVREGLDKKMHHKYKEIQLEANRVKLSLIDFDNGSSFRKYVLRAFDGVSDELRSKLKKIIYLSDHQDKPLAEIASIIISFYVNDVNKRINELNEMDQKISGSFNKK